MEQQADVIVVGAGPAGATTAHLLAKAGRKVALLEKTSFPRETLDQGLAQQAGDARDRVMNALSHLAPAA